LQKVKDCSKGKKGWGWIDLRHNEIDSHFFPKEEGVEDLKILEKAFAAGVLEFFVNAAVGEMNLGMEDGKVENEC
jgi:hypothetical protein